MSFDASNETGGASVPTGAQSAKDVGGAGVWPGNGASATDVGTANLPGVGPQTAAFDHAHKGVHSVNGLFGDVLVNGVITLGGIATGTTQLVSLPSVNLTAGALAYVVTVGDFFRLQQSALTTDGITVIAAFGKAGYQWVRLLVSTPSNKFVGAWSVDPAAGNDEFDGLTDATALKTLQEVKRRIWGLELQQTTTVRILTDTAPTDIGTWNFTIAAQAGGALSVGRLTLLGVLGASTGPGSTAHDNTLYSGSLTSPPTVPANVPSVDDYEITDTAIPASYAASGLLGAGVIFKRTNGTARYWYGLKDLGAKTLRISNPVAGNGVSTWFALTNGDTYSAYQMVKIYGQLFPGNMAEWVQFDSVDDEAAVGQEQTHKNAAPTRTRNWVGHANGRTVLCVNFQAANCMIDLGAAGNILTAGPSGQPIVSGGAFLGTGASTCSFTGNVVSLTGIPCFQGCALTSNDIADVEIEGGTVAFYDCTVACLQPFAGARFAFQPGQAGTGFSGKGNSSKLIDCTAGGTFYYGFNTALPPFVAGSTSDTSPIKLNNESFRVADLPTVIDVTLSGNLHFGGSAGMGATEASFISEEIDFAAAPATYQLIPSKPGYYFSIRQAECIVTSATGTMVTTVTWGAGNNGTTNDNLVSSQGNPTAAVFAVILTLVPNKCSLSVVAFGTAKSQLLDLTTAAVVRVTIAAILGGASTFRGRMNVVGQLIPIGL